MIKGGFITVGICFCFFIFFSGNLGSEGKVLTLADLGQNPISMTSHIGVLEDPEKVILFVIAFLLLTTGGLMVALRALAGLPTNVLTVNSLQFGSAFEMILLAFALADRFNEIRKEKIVSDALIKENLKRSNIDLEKKVTERTLALNDSLNIFKQDIGLAKRIQQNTLLRNIPNNIDLKIVPTYLPLAEVGGDYYCVSKLNDFTYRFFLADATGHGVQAAMITMAIKGVYDYIKQSELETAKVMEIFNNEYMNQFDSLNSFMTAILIDLDIKNKKLKYVSAGHPGSILITNEKFITMKNTGRLIGVVKDTNYQALDFEFTPGDRLFIFTDGVFEEFNSRNEEFGEERLYSILSGNRKESIEQNIVEILGKLDLFLEGTEKQDDLTILGIEYKTS